MDTAKHFPTAPQRCAGEPECGGCGAPSSELEHVDGEANWYCPVCGTRTPDDFTSERREESGRLVEPSAEQVASAQSAAIRDIEARRQAFAQRRRQAEAEGVPALVRLVHVAQGDSGQCHHVRRFLLGLFNGPVWPFDLTRLRALDVDLQDAALAVLRMDMEPRCEVHQRIEGGDFIFEEFWRTEDPDCERHMFQNREG